MTDDQRKAIEPHVARLRELAQAYEHQRSIVTLMASMIEPKITDPESGVSLNLDTLEFQYPESEAARTT